SVDRLLTDVAETAASIRVDEEGAVQRLAVEIDTAIGLENIQLRIGQQREGEASFFLVSGQRFLEVVRRIGTDGDQIDPGVSELAGILRKTVELLRAPNAAGTLVENHHDRPALVLTQRDLLTGTVGQAPGRSWFGPVGR